VTIWRLRESRPEDKTKELIEEDGVTTKWTPERIDEATPLRAGDRVRLSIESLSRDGYLYVIDREQYSDGTTGEPLLVFPTLKNGENNKVKAGRLVYIPSIEGKFRITPRQSEKVQTAELITIKV
jgi:hypothetical protein